MNLPIAFEEKMKALLGDEYDAYLRCYENPGIMVCESIQKRFLWKNF